MKLTIERSALLKSLSHIQSVVERRNTIPILSNVKLTATADGLAMNATDMDMDMAETVVAEIAEPGATTAPAHTLYDIVRRLPDGAQVDMSVSDGALELKAGRSRFSLACLPVEEFPVMSGGDMPVSFSLSSDSLKGLIDRTRFAVSTEETRYYLNGIFLHVASKGGVDALKAAATDGHRLACVDVALPDGAAGMPSVIVPRKTVAELRKLIDEAEGDIQLSLSESKIRFSFDNVVLTSKLIDGTYPDYERVIPADNDRTLTVPADTLAHAVDRVSVISEKSKGVKILVGKGQITLSASSAENGSAVEELEADYDGEALEIGFNSRYLLDILQQISGDTVRLDFSDPASPMVVVDAADESAVYVLMPMRV